MAKKKVGRPKKRGKRKTGTRVRVKGYTRIIAVFNGATRAHAKKVRVKGYTRKKPKKRAKKRKKSNPCKRRKK